jgi:ribosomal protein S18 acetylase RimI-like enzyme
VEIRPFDGSRRDARGIIDVDRATFGDCPYTSQQILDLESDPRQYAWVAVEEQEIVGFVSAFATHGLAASRWEVDELAVHPRAQGRGIGTALVSRALEEGVRQVGLTEARALVAVDNGPSARVFGKCGFAPMIKVYLMLYLIEGRTPRPRRSGWPAVRHATGCDIDVITSLSGYGAARVAAGLARHASAYLVAEREGDVLGYAELIHVRTLQYEGFWIESWNVFQQEKQVASALLNGAIEEAKRRESFDEVGVLISPDATALMEAAIGEGLKRQEMYRVFVRELSR